VCRWVVTFNFVCMVEVITVVVVIVVVGNIDASHTGAATAHAASPATVCLSFQRKVDQQQPRRLSAA
jgi:hypothetical protein